MRRLFFLVLFALAFNPSAKAEPYEYVPMDEFLKEVPSEEFRICASKDKQIIFEVPGQFEVVMPIYKPCSEVEHEGRA
jgi:hypothetical protein